MRRPLALSAAAAATAAFSLVGAPAIAQDAGAATQGSANPVVVSGVVTCSHAGPVGRQAVTWTLDNGSSAVLTINTASEAGTIDSAPFSNPAVDFTPNPVPAASPDNHATAGDGPFGGTSTGTITLTVNWTFPDGEFPQTNNSTGTVTLPGGCVNDPTTTASTTTTIRTTTTVAAAVVSTPTFTG